MKLKAKGTKVLIRVDQGKDEHEGIHLGRRIERPFGVVFSVGELVKDQDLLGRRVMFQRDLGAEVEFEGQIIACLDTETTCPHCRRRLLKDEVLGIVEYDGGEEVEIVQRHATDRRPRLATDGAGQWK